MKSTNSANPPGTRHCRHCRRDLPLDATHFHRHAHHKHGFREVCKSCRSRTRKHARQERYGKAEKTLLLKYAQHIRAGKDLPSHEELHFVLSQFLGGTEGIARSFHRHLEEAKPGCRLAVALITTLVNLTVSQENLRRRRQEERQSALAQMSQEELQEKLEQDLQAMLDRAGWEVVPKGSRCAKCSCTDA